MEAATQTAESASADKAGIVEGYAHEHRPLLGYSMLTAGFFAGFAGALLAARRSGRELPGRVGPWDVITAGAATHKLSRLLAKDRVTSFLRAPFTEYEDSSGHGELEEKPRGRGLRLATGELVVCPYCLGQWVAAAFGVGMVAAPRFTRLVAFIYTAETVGDFLQLAYSAAEEKS
jgi:hypothetical protein